MSNDQSEKTPSENLLLLRRLKKERAAVLLAMKNLLKKHTTIISNIPDEVEEDAETNSLRSIRNFSRSRASEYLYSDNGNETITDMKTGLLWKRYCETENYTWPDAMHRFNGDAEQIEFAGFSDWRLPTIEELKTLVLKYQDPKICEEAFPDSSRAFWSSSPVGTNDDAYAINFCLGDIDSVDANGTLAVRLVRDRTGEVSKLFD